MLINLKVKTLDARTHEFSIDNEQTIRQFKDQIAEQTNIAAENQRIIYQGRVLADDKLVKDYDVDGKVLHVAERPPFSQRGANATNNDEPMRNLRSMAGRPAGPRNMRNSPYFRALDGMLVGTMAIPVNNGPLNAAGTRTPPNRFPNSSSFCINRITVALHMIDCANNIAAYLENPEVGLNNQSLDILQRGRWTMESTVVEVGVSSTDMPRNNNIIDMVQDAVTAALSRNTPGRNYTVVQLPTVYTNEGGEGQQQQRGGNGGGGSEGAAGGGTTASSETSEETTAAAAVIIEDGIETDDEAADGSGLQQSNDERPNSPVGGVAPETGANGNDAAAAAAEDSASNVAVTGIGPRRRTRPQVLANVIQRYRTVQTRLSPFVDSYYEILNQDPAFGEQQDAARESAQRIFDRVSEAFHYLSHAQHAISDLMLDLSQPGPRVLTCRPILVEQSGYIRSNNIFTPNLVASPLNELIAQAPPTSAAAAQRGAAAATAPPPPSTSAVPPTPATSRGAAAATAPPPPPIFNFPTERDRWMANNAAEAAEAAAAAAVVAGFVTASENVEDPVDEPMVATSGATPAGERPQQSRPELEEPAAVADLGEAPMPRFRMYIPVPLPPPNPQVQMARLIQAVVNSAQNDADVHVEFNVPNVMSINLPVHVMAAAVHPQGRPAAAIPTDTTTATGGDANVAAAGTATPGAAGAIGTPSTSSGTQRANTLPTTATQTRSTARPQIQIGGNNNWAGRIAPTHTAFDRFLPCNSHHIREPEPLIQASNNNSSSSNNSSSNRRVANNSSTVSNAIVIASRLPRGGQSGTSLSRPLSRRRIAINRENRTGSLPGIATVGGVGGSRALPPTVRPMQRTISRLISAMFDNFLVTNMRNHAQTGVPTTGGAATNANASATSTTTATLPTAAALRLAGIRTVAGNGITTTTATDDATATTNNANSSSMRCLPALVRETSKLRTQLRTFLLHSVFEGSAINEETTVAAISRALDWFGDSLLYLPQYERPEYNSRDSVCNTVRQSLRLVIDLCSASEPRGAQFEQRLKQICDEFRKRLFSVLLLCLGSANAELYWRQLMRLLLVPLRSNFQNEALQFLYIYIDPTIPVQTDTADAQQFLVLRNAQSTQTDPDQLPQPPQQPEQQSLDSDIEMAEVACSSSSSSATEEPPLPDVNVGSEPWHRNFHEDWLPVITRDLQTQTEQNREQPPYSDAYISGMSAKRRKIIQTEKPTSNVECLIASGVQRAIQTTGLGAPNGQGGSPTVANPDVVIGAIAHDAVVQASYTEAVRNNARERLKNDMDYKPSKYPQIAKFTEQQK